MDEIKQIIKEWGFENISNPFSQLLAQDNDYEIKITSCLGFHWVVLTKLAFPRTVYVGVFKKELIKEILDLNRN